MSQDQFPLPEASDQEPQTLPEASSETIPAAQQPETPSDITPETSLAASEQLSLEESEVKSQESEAEIDVTSETPLIASEPPFWGESGVGSRELGVEEPPVSSEKPTSQTIQETWNRVRPVLQTQTIKALRGTIQLLEGMVERLEEAGAPGSGKRSEIMPPTSETVPDKLVPPFLTDKLGEKFHSLWQRLQRWWATVLPQIRERLPESLNQKFSDRALTGAIVTVLFLFLWIVPGLFSSKPELDPVAKAPPTQKITLPAAKPTVPPQISTSEPAKPIAPKSAEEKPAPKSVKVSPSPVVSPPPPPPPLKLTPEQKLIARIQDQVAEISNRYVSGLIQSVQANFRSSRLTVKVGNGWYGLSQLQQTKLADEMLGRTQKLDFSKLEITDVEGTLLARSPVVGLEMIILKREREGGVKS